MKMADGFNSWEGNATLWIVYHDQGTTHVHATSEAIALQRFLAKFPNRSVQKIVRFRQSSNTKIGKRADDNRPRI